MRNRLSAAAIIVLVGAGPAHAQWLQHRAPRIPRPSDGKPNLTAPAPPTADKRVDLSGLWLLDPGGYGLNLVSDLTADDVMPWAAARYKERSANFSKDYPGFRCFPDIGPLFVFGRFKILQSPGVLAILSEQGLYRQIHTDGRALPTDPNPTWMGYSVGRWEGKTLVVETAGFNDQTWLDFGGHPHTAALRVTERYTRKDFGHMRIEMTFDDPQAYRRPWTIALDAELTPDTELLEYVCNENEKDVAHFIVTDEDRRKAEAAARITPAVLQQYVGSYDLVDLEGKHSIMTVALSGTELVVQPPTGGKFPLVPETETMFTAAGAKVEFFKDDSGTVTHFVVSTVEGDQKGTRKR